MTAASDTPTPAQAEADVEHARAGLVGTLNQLRENLKPGNMADEVMSNAKITASAVTDQVWDVARKNPIPALLIGAGAAMILGLGTKAASNGTATAPDTLGETNEQVRSVASRGRQAVKQFRQSTQGQQGQPEKTMSQYARTRNQISGSLSKLINEQPLILAAFGLAVGAAIGAAIPQTDTENSLLGEHAHALRDKAQDVAQGQLEQIKAAASHAVDDIKHAATDHGLSSDNLGGLVHDVAGHAKSATYEAGRALDPTT